MYSLTHRYFYCREEERQEEEEGEKVGSDFRDGF